ncbi:hypothetical protein [Pseudolactococcus carnosus]|uniref:hypothetical protein n=1 Tax=Pseudolactococcus carnosus TaxID=2749961 RepID=UPI0008129B04|nr:hypothetical protein [Lactococcus carnosus]MCJ1968718.1 hypothetical protein [Lactococcus carnosus]SCA91766.1 hypothetical protein LP2241_20537 [Lactococcus piscium]
MNIENNKYFSELNEWYDDIDMYNIIGFLHIYGNVSFIEIKKIINNSDEPSISKLKDMSKNLILKNTKDTIYELDTLFYVKDGPRATGRRKHINTVLFLFNVAYATELKIRLDFDYFFKNNQDNFQIEHIIASHDDTITTIKPKDLMWNLSLLDGRTNVALSNDVFYNKKIYLYNNRDTCKLLPCTEAVFNKTFSTNNNNMDFWSEEDGCDYIKKMKSTLIDFLY